MPHVDYYVYALLDPTKPGRFAFGDYCFLYEPFYIGKGRGNRCYASVGRQERSANPRSPKARHLVSLVNKGIRPLHFKIATCLEEDQAYALEQVVIRTIGRRIVGEGPFVNFEKGGGGTSAKRARAAPAKREMPQTVRDKISASHKARPPKTQEHRDKISAALSGRKLPPSVIEKLVGRTPWSKGKKLPPLSEEHKAKLAGRKLSGQALENVRGGALKRRGRPRPPEVGAKISAAKKGKPNLKLRGRKRPSHVVEAMQAGIARKRAEQRAQRASV